MNHPPRFVPLTTGSNPSRDPPNADLGKPATINVVIMTSAVSTAQENSPLFASSYISPETNSALPEGYTIRPLQRSDYGKGFLDVLRVLTSVGDISADAFSQQFDWMSRERAGDYFVVVVCDGNGRVVGAGTLIVERKFVHGLGKVGHIEDICVATDQQGKKLGLRIIQTLDHIAKKIGCYKVRNSLSPYRTCLFDCLLILSILQSILNCAEKNEGFYVKCGFKRAEVEMAHYY